MKRRQLVPAAVASAAVLAACVPVASPTPKPVVAKPPTTKAPTTTKAPATTTKPTTTTVPSTQAPSTVPPTSGGTAPSVTLEASRPSGVVPHTTAVTWQIGGTGPFSCSLKPAAAVAPVGFDCNADGVRTISYAAAGSYQVSLTVTSAHGTATASTTVAATTPGSVDPFDIEVVNPAGLYASDIAAATARWKAVIGQGLEDFPPMDPAPAYTGFCTPLASLHSAPIDDVALRIDIVDLGDDDILGRGGYCLTHGGFPRAGRMELNSQYLSTLTSAQRIDLITHEIGHILGLGTLNWGSFVDGNPTDGSLVKGTASDAPHYVGAAAKGIWQAWGRFGSVPVQPGAVQGSSLSHWSETVLRNELMTPAMDTGGAPTTNPLSQLTVAALADLGYSVNVGAAEPFNTATLGSLQLGVAALGNSRIHEGHAHTEWVPLG